MPCCQALDSLISERYFENAPTVGLIDISLSLTTISICVWRWPMSLSASRDSPLISAASPTTTAIALEPVPQVARLRQAFRDRQPRTGVPAVEDVVRRFGPAWEPADAVELAKRPEPLEPAGQQLVRVGLVAGVPDDPVARRLEQAVQRDGQLDHAERRPEVAAGPGDGPDDGVADLDGELGELDLVEAAQVGGVLDGRQDRHGGGNSWVVAMVVPGTLAVTDRTVRRVMMRSRRRTPGWVSGRV